MLPTPQALEEAAFKRKAASSLALIVSPWAHVHVSDVCIFKSTAMTPGSWSADTLY